jgi:hypothetical protein
VSNPSTDHPNNKCFEETRIEAKNSARYMLLLFQGQSSVSRLEHKTQEICGTRSFSESNKPQSSSRAHPAKH